MSDENRVRNLLWTYLSGNPRYLTKKALGKCLCLLTLGEFAESIGVSPQAVCSGVRRGKYPPPALSSGKTRFWRDEDVHRVARTRSGCKLNDEQQKEVCNLYRKGLSQVEIAKRFEVTQTLISRTIERHDVDKDFKATDLQKILKLTQKGWTQKQIAKELGCSQVLISLRLKKIREQQ